jgi:hypothetical protein
VDRSTLTRFVLPAIIIVVTVLSVVILTGLASQNPDGLEWSLYSWAGVPEPEGGFGGIFAFLGEGPFVDMFKGITGIILVLVMAFLLFRYASRKAE